MTYLYCLEFYASYKDRPPHQPIGHSSDIEHFCVNQSGHCLHHLNVSIHLSILVQITFKNLLSRSLYEHIIFFLSRPFSNTIIDTDSTPKMTNMANKRKILTNLKKKHSLLEMTWMHIFWSFSYWIWNQ